MEDTAVMDTTSTETICSKCKSVPANLAIGAFRPFCDSCWAAMNKKKSESMLAKNLKRGNPTRAAMSASKKVKKAEEPEKWMLYYDFYLEQLDKRNNLSDKVQSLNGEK